MNNYIDFNGYNAIVNRTDWPDAINEGFLEMSCPDYYYLPFNYSKLQCVFNSEKKKSEWVGTASSCVPGKQLMKN